MKLKCRINGKEYDIVQGASFTDNLNETLDSGTICIDQVPEITDLKPYDDVYIWDSSEEFEGYYNKGDNVDLSSRSSSVVVNFRRSSVDIFDDFEISNLDDFSGKSGLIYEGINNDNFLVFSGTFVDLLIDTLFTDVNNRFNVFNKVIKFRFERLSSPSGVFCDFLLTFEERWGSKKYFLENSDNDLKWDCYFDEKIGKMYVNAGEMVNYVIGNEIMIPIWNRTTLGEDYTVKVNKSIQKLITLSIDDLMINNVFEGGVISFKYKGAWVDRYIYNITKLNQQETRITYGKNIVETETITFVNGEYGFSDVEYDRNNWKSFVDDIKIKHWKCVMSSNSTLPSIFFKHMLIDSYSCSRLNLGNTYKDEKVLFKYSINLFSEIKKIEKTILPNISITQSIVKSEKRSCWFYLNNFLKLYSPKIKMADDQYEKTWKYVQKYTISDSKNEYLENGKTQYVTNLKEVFENTICPEMSWTAPSLRDVLNQIFSVKDLIPVVFNDVIYGLNIGAMDETLPVFNRNGVNFDVGNMSSSDYATDARREYSGALTQENSAHMIEYMGFRNINSPFLTFSSMAIQTRFPIYKINTIKLCYYKKYYLVKKDGSEEIPKMFMCKYNITPLVLQNAVRNSLYTNYESFEQDLIEILENNNFSSKEKLEKIAKYQLCTVGYDIGSNIISGWGTTYEYLQDFTWFKAASSYLENILKILNKISFEGTEIFTSELRDFNDDYVVNYSEEEELEDNIVSFNDEQGLGSEMSKYKSIVFEIDYDAMYSGAVVHSKDFIEDDDITTVDNCSTSLAVLETDGLFEKEKLNRMSNKQFKFTARYDERTGGALYSNIQELGTLDRDYTNATIYSREYQIYDNCILANYSASYNYILKNYFTSVWAKYRTYSFMSYGESVKRTENFRQLILLSTKKQYYEYEGNEFLQNYENYSNFLNFLIYSEHNSYKFLSNTQQINCGYFEINHNKYLSDINSFASGTSLCFNISMYDNISGGLYIETLSNKFVIGKGISSWVSKEQAEKLVKDNKATQGWYQTVTSDSDAFIENIGVYVCHFDNAAGYDDIVLNSDVPQKDKDGIFLFGRRLMNLPLLDEQLSKTYCTNIIGSVFNFSKDNKETIDFTYQFDYIPSDKDTIMFSPWIAKLNDLLGVYNKRAEVVKLEYDIVENAAIDCFIYDKNFYGKKKTYLSGSTSYNRDTAEKHTKTIVIKIPKIEREKLIDRTIEKGTVILNNNSPYATLYIDAETYYDFEVGGPTYYNIVSGNSEFRVKEISLENQTLENEDGEIVVSLDTMKIRGEFEYEYAYEIIGRQLETGKGPTETHREIVRVEQNVKNFEITLTGGETFSSAIVVDKPFEDSNYYYYFADIDENIFRITEVEEKPNQGAGGYWDIIYPEVGKTGPKNIKDCTDNNSYETEMIGLLAEPKYVTYPSNMVIVKSTEKMPPELIYDTFKIDEDGEINFKEEMTLDTQHNFRKMFIVTASPSPKIWIRSSLYEPNIKSVQYYYKDDNGYLHFVFGVNIDKDEAGNNKDMTIYLSCISKRSMKVYDNNHNVIGYAANYADPDNTFQYGTGQYYKEVE